MLGVNQLKLPILTKWEMFYCYILKSLKSGRYYVGSTENVESRLKLHNTGNVVSTSSYRPWKTVYVESFTSFRDARSKEKQIKRWKSRKAIERLIKTFPI